MEQLFDTRHLLTPSTGLLSDIVSTMTCVPTERVMELMDLGSIYVNGLRAETNSTISPGTYLRVHLKPKRYSVQEIEWDKHIVFQDSHMIVVNKPKSIPVHPMVDNKIENVAVQLARHLGQPLYVTQRLDVVTQGLFVLAKTKEFQSAFNLMLKEKRIFKSYRTRVEKPVALGEHRHFMLSSPRSPKIMANQPSLEGVWLECVLNILNCEPVEDKFHVQIELITGRTHQIRAQLAHLGSPICGDPMYGPSHSNEDFFLLCDQLRFENPLDYRGHAFKISQLSL